MAKSFLNNGVTGEMKYEWVRKNIPTLTSKQRILVRKLLNTKSKNQLFHEMAYSHKAQGTLHPIVESLDFLRNYLEYSYSTSCPRNGEWHDEYYCEGCRYRLPVYMKRDVDDILSEAKDIAHRAIDNNFLGREYNG